MWITQILIGFFTTQGLTIPALIATFLTKQGLITWVFVVHKSDVMTGLNLDMCISSLELSVFLFVSLSCVQFELKVLEKNVNIISHETKSFMQKYECNGFQ